MAPKPPDEAELHKRRAGWKYHGQARPVFADIPGPGQESVWDYPRPPALVRDKRLVEVRAGGLLLARSARAVRVLETGSPPTIYLPREDADLNLLQRTKAQSFCEWKGEAGYFDLVTAETRLEKVAWSYEQPFPAFTGIAGYLSFYPQRVECFVDGERVRPQAGGYYGGWVTDEVVGPYKGQPGTESL
ncbi:MAG: DUF427 domain-containing protein [Pseudomonadota bacterium]